MLAAGWIYRRHYMYLNGDAFAITMCGDNGAHAESLQSFRDFWDLKHPCCVPPGLCRDLKAQGLSSQDLCFGNAKAFLHWIASTFQCSIADVESLHSQNRALGGNAFSSIAAKFINSESKRVAQEAVNLQQPSQDVPVGKSKCSGPKRGGVIVHDTTSGCPKPKAMSALELFRKHYLQTKQACGEVVNPCSKEIWNEVRRAYEQLTPDELRLFQSLSEESKAQAACTRAQQKHAASKTQQAADSDQTSRDGVAPASSSEVVQHNEWDGFGQPLHPLVLPLHQLVEALPSDTDMGKLRQVVDKQLSQNDDVALVKNKYPLSDSTLEKVWRAQLDQGITGKDFYRKFVTDSEHIARPQMGDDVFPTKVLHESFCGVQCRHHDDRKRIDMHCYTLEVCKANVTENLGH